MTRVGGVGHCAGMKGLVTPAAATAVPCRGRRNRARLCLHCVHSQSTRVRRETHPTEPSRERIDLEPPAGAAPELHLRAAIALSMRRAIVMVTQARPTGARRPARAGHPLGDQIDPGPVGDPVIPRPVPYRAWGSDDPGRKHASGTGSVVLTVAARPTPSTSRGTPRAGGGVTLENCVVRCSPCNHRSDRLLTELGYPAGAAPPIGPHWRPLSAVKELDLSCAILSVRVRPETRWTWFAS